MNFFPFEFAVLSMQIICTIVFLPSVSLPTSKRRLMAVYKHPSCTRMARLEAEQSVFSDFLFVFYIWKHSNRYFQIFFSCLEAQRSVFSKPRCCFPWCSAPPAPRCRFKSRGFSDFLWGDYSTWKWAPTMKNVFLQPSHKDYFLYLISLLPLEPG